MLNPDILAEALAELNAWQDGKKRHTQTDRQHSAPKKELRRCSCGCGNEEWNRTGMCEASYFRTYRDKQNVEHKQKELEQRVRTPLSRGRPLLLETKPCKCGRPVVAQDRCRRCYTAFRKLNPKKCDCGNYFRIRGTKCKRCVEEMRTYRMRQRVGNCKCGRKASFVNGDCRTCRKWQEVRDGTREMCSCGRGPKETKDVCMVCYGETYYHTARGHWNTRTYQQKRRTRTRGTPRTHDQPLTVEEQNERRRLKRQLDETHAEKVKRQGREHYARNKVKIRKQQKEHRDRQKQPHSIEEVR